MDIGKTFDRVSKSPYTVTMRGWDLHPGDPLLLTLAADHRLCTPDLQNDHAWEMEMGAGSPPALAVRTTYSLRARAMRIFPRFEIQGRYFCDPQEFYTAPRLRFFTPNYLKMDFEILPGLQVQAETWIPDSHTLAGRWIIVNLSGEPRHLRFELCGQLFPLDGEGLGNVLMHSTCVLSGRTGTLHPVIFLAGGPIPAEGPHPGLALNLALATGGERQLTWAQAALGSQEESFEHARQTTLRPWEAEISRLELLNQSSVVEVHTGDPDWDAAFAFSQKQALSLFIRGRDDQTGIPFVSARATDLPCLPADENDPEFQARLPSDLDCLYMSNVLAGCPESTVKLVRSLLDRMDGVGLKDRAGQEQIGNTMLPFPVLAGIAWEAYQRVPDLSGLKDLYPRLEKYLDYWLDDIHDRDGDGLPEGDLNPVDEWDKISFLHEDGLHSKVMDCPDVESPALGAMLYHDLLALAGMAGELGLEGRQMELQGKAERLREVVEECRDSRAGVYHRRDSVGHRSPSGNDLATLRGMGAVNLGRSFPYPTRLKIVVSPENEWGSDFFVSLCGRDDTGSIKETFPKNVFQRKPGTWQVNSRHLYQEIVSMQVAGMNRKGRVTLLVMDFSQDDIAMLLPIWAGIPSPEKLDQLMKRHTGEGKFYSGIFGIPDFLGKAKDKPSGGLMHLPLNALIAEGLASFGRQEEAVRLLGGMMRAIILNLKKNKAFMQSFDAKTGWGVGAINSVQGLAPLGAFLKLLGVEFHPPGSVKVTGKNPFPWQVTVQYRGIVVTRHVDGTEVSFPGGRKITISDLTDAVVDAE